MRCRAPLVAVALSALLTTVFGASAHAIVFYSILPPNGAGQTTFSPPRRVSAADVGVPPGYSIEAVVTGLTYPTAVVTDEADQIYILEAGYSYGEDFKVARLLRLEADGQLTEIAQGGDNGPWTGMSYHDG